MPLFAELDSKALSELAEITEEMVFSPGDVLIKEGDDSDCMYVIARGAARVYKKSRGKEILLDTLGGGDIVGEMALLTGDPRNASVHAATTLTVGRIDQDDFQRIMQETPSLRASVWSAFSQHAFDNLVRRDWRFSSLSHDDCVQWWSSHESCGELEAGEVADPTLASTGELAEFLFLSSGSLDISGTERSAPALLGVDEHSVYRVVTPAHVLRLGPAPAAASD